MLFFALEEMIEALQGMTQEELDDMLFIVQEEIARRKEDGK